jgi:hypothetical protein
MTSAEWENILEMVAWAVGGYLFFVGIFLLFCKRWGGRMARLDQAIYWSLRNKWHHS